MQDEEQLRQLISGVVNCHDQYRAIVARISQKIALTAKEAEAYKASQQPVVQPDDDLAAAQVCGGALAAICAAPILQPATNIASLTYMAIVCKDDW